MGRYLCLSIALVTLGCQGRPVNLDPFGTYGPTTVPPPSTGSAGRPDPYYRRAQAAEPWRDGARSAATSPAQTSRFTSDEQRSEAASTADRRNRPSEGAGTSTSGGVRELDWRSPGAVRPLSSSDTSSGRVRPRFYPPVTGASGLIEPTTIDEDVARVSSHLPVNEGSGGWSSVDSRR